MVIHRSRYPEASELVVPSVRAAVAVVVVLVACGVAATVPRPATASVWGDMHRYSDMGSIWGTTYNTYMPDVVYNPVANEYLVVWTGDDDATTVDNELEIFGQRVDAATGEEVGPNDFRISGIGQPGATCEFPAVAHNPARNQYLVVWIGPNAAGPPDDREVFGQLLDAAGTEIGGDDFRISDQMPPGELSQAFHVEVVANPVRDEYLAVWGGMEDFGNGMEFEVFAQRIEGETGQLIGGAIRVSDMALTVSSWGNPIFVDVAYSSTRNEYLVVWNGTDDQGGMAENEPEIFVQRLTALGVEVGANDLRISDVQGIGSTDGAALLPSVAYDATDDQYLVVWEAQDVGGGLSGEEMEIFGQRIDGASGLETGSNDFRISDMGGSGGSDYLVAWPRVTYDPRHGEYLVVWYGEDDVDGMVQNEFEIFAQRIDAASGSEIGIDDERISFMGGSGDDRDHAIWPALACQPDTGQQLVVWSGDHNVTFPVSYQDGYEIFGVLRSSDLLLDSGFETGDLSEWSTVAP